MGQGHEVLARVAAPSPSSLAIPRLLVVLAHPDDEVIALGARLERLTGSRLVTVTDGAPAEGSDARELGFSTLEAYREARRQELLAALAHAGLPPDVAPSFAQQVPDQRASLHLAQLARAIAAEMEDFAPEAVLTHPYEGGHPDHDACALAVRAAVELSRARHPSRAVAALLESPFYHIAEHGSMRTGAFLRDEKSSPIICCELSPEEQTRKRARLACFGSQTATLAQFGTERELYRVAPTYDFLQPPHAGPLFYEHFPWGMTGDRFCALAQAALQELFGQESTHDANLQSVAMQ